MTHKEGPDPPKKRVPTNLEPIFRKLRSLDDKLLRLELHTEFLGKYRANKATPKGLSVNIQPSFGRTDTGFMNQWKRTCERCSSDLLDLTIDQLGVELETTKVLRVSADSSLASTATSDEGIIVRTVLKELRERRTEQLLKTKKAKFEALLDPKNQTGKKDPKTKKQHAKTLGSKRRGGNKAGGKKSGVLKDLLSQLANFL